jgi:hypothetical protein
MVLPVGEPPAFVVSKVRDPVAVTGPVKPIDPPFDVILPFTEIEEPV